MVSNRFAIFAQIHFGFVNFSLGALATELSTVSISLLFIVFFPCFLLSPIDSINIKVQKSIQAAGVIQTFVNELKQNNFSRASYLFWPHNQYYSDSYVYKQPHALEQNFQLPFIRSWIDHIVRLSTQMEWR